jgi:hypothetical protein
MIVAAAIRIAGYWLDRELRIGGRYDVQMRSSRSGHGKALCTHVHRWIHAASCELLLDSRKHFPSGSPLVMLAIYRVRPRTVLAELRRCPQMRLR